MPAIRPLVPFLALSLLAACGQEPALTLPWGQPEPPVEQALAASCQGDATVAPVLDGAINAARGSLAHWVRIRDGKIAVKDYYLKQRTS